MDPVFVDTGGWAALFVRGEKGHSAAAQLYQQLRSEGRKFITTNYVLVELMALLSSPLRLPRATQFQYIDSIRASKVLDIVHVDTQMDSAAYAFLKTRADKEWSLVDAVSFLVMQEYKITEALTTDHHFEQAGFVRLIK